MSFYHHFNYYFEQGENYIFNKLFSYQKKKVLSVSSLIIFLISTGY